MILLRYWEWSTMRTAISKSSRFSNTLDCTDFSVEAQLLRWLLVATSVQQVKDEKRSSLRIVCTTLWTVKTNGTGPGLKSHLSLTSSGVRFRRKNGDSTRVFRSPKVYGKTSSLAGLRYFRHDATMQMTDTSGSAKSLSHSENEQNNLQFGQNDPAHRAYIAFGSNLGDRVGHIERALLALSQKGLPVRSMSFLYETEPMYVRNQDSFLNGVCEVSSPSLRLSNC
jgi:hypothetical protein